MADSADLGAVSSGSFSESGQTAVCKACCTLGIPWPPQTSPRLRSQRKVVVEKRKILKYYEMLPDHLDSARGTGWLHQGDMEKAEALQEDMSMCSGESMAGSVNRNGLYTCCVAVSSESYHNQMSVNKIQEAEMERGEGEQVFGGG